MARLNRGGRLPTSLLVGGGLFALLVAMVVAAPWVAPYPYDEMDIMAIKEAPSLAHWFGTDEFGRDVLSRLLIGGRTSLFLGAAATAVSLFIGIPLGLLAGYLRGVVDEALMRIIDVLMSVPPILMGLLILSATRPSVWKTAIAVGIIYVPVMTRLVRSVALDLSREEFVLAAQGRGERLPWILLREILPNAWPSIIVEASLRMTFAVMLAAALSFLGLGVQPPSSDWGLMISEARPFIDSAPWIVLGPGLALCVTVVAINLMGDGLRNLLDPRMRGRA
ncbi:ABC transporter permease [Muricoccus vinaceus]|uniref:ABC transporter permease n=1 Tax=Muricoccus vinaceus TaxID=424704 RepID=A0ABV6ITD4_9PROT